MLVLKNWKSCKTVFGLLLSLLFVATANGQVTKSFENRERIKPAEAQDEAGIAAQEIAVIEGLLAAQEQSWNAQDIEGFMDAYWKSEQMSFGGGGELVRGWQATLDRYRKNYPPEKMGTLNFRNLETRLIGPTAAMVLGNYRLDLQGEKKEGGFTLVWQKFDIGWRIIHDHTSAAPVKPTLPQQPDDVTK